MLGFCFLLRNDLVIHFIRFNHAKFEPRALLYSLKPLLQIAHIGIERGVASGELNVFRFLLIHLARKFPHLQPAAFAEPKRVLDRDDEREKGVGEVFHSSGFLGSFR